MSRFAPPPPRMLRRDLPQPGTEHPLDLDHQGGWAALGAADWPTTRHARRLSTPEPLTEHWPGPDRWPASTRPRQFQGG